MEQPRLQSTLNRISYSFSGVHFFAKFAKSNTFEFTVTTKPKTSETFDFFKCFSNVSALETSGFCVRCNPKTSKNENVKFRCFANLNLKRQ